MLEDINPPEKDKRLFGWFPHLGREERQELAGRIRQEATGGPDFYVMMLLASALASLGLLQGSTAVVIGAMLVAPLVGPLIGAALALVQGNIHLMRIALQVALGASCWVSPYPCFSA